MINSVIIRSAPEDTILVSRSSCNAGNRSLGYEFSIDKHEVLKLAGTTSDGYIILHQKHRGDDKCFTNVDSRYRLAYKNEAILWKKK